MNLENLLRDIQTDRANLQHGCLPHVVSLTPPLWRIDAIGGVHSIRTGQNDWRRHGCIVAASGHLRPFRPPEDNKLTVPSEMLIGP